MIDDFNIPEKPMGVGGIYKKTLGIFFSRIHFILIFAIAVYAAYRWFLLMPGVDSWLNGFFETAKSGLFYNIYNAFGGLDIALNNIQDLQEWKAFIFANLPALGLGLLVQPFIFGTVTLIAAASFRKEKRSFGKAFKDTVLQYWRYFKLSFTMFYMSVLVIFVLAMILGILIAVGATLSSSLNIFTFWVMVALSCLLAVLNFFASLAYAVMTVEGKLSYKALGHSVLLVSSRKLMSLATVGVITLVQLGALALVQFLTAYITDTQTLMVIVSSVLLPLPWIAAVCLYFGIKQDRIAKDESSPAEPIETPEETASES